MTDQERQLFERESIRNLHSNGFSVAALQAVYPHVTRDEILAIVGDSRGE